MEKIVLKAETRNAKGNLKKMRAEGMMPVVCYGSGTESRSLVVKSLDFERVFDKAGENTVIELEIDGKDKLDVLIYDLQVDIMSGKFTHADLLVVDMAKEIEAEIPLTFVGIAPAVKALGGVLVTGLDSVTVKCLPGNIPHEFVVNLETIATFEDHITIGSLNAPEGVEFIVAPETIIASVTPPRSEEELSSLNEKVEEDVSKVGASVEKKVEETTEEKK